MLLNSVISLSVLVAGIRATPVKHQQRQAPAGVPDFVLKHAPVVYLHSSETYLPSDIQSQLSNSVPEVNYNEVPAPSPLDLNNVNALGGDVWITSKDDITKDPEWIKGVKPDGNGKTNNAVTAAIIVNDKGDGNVDAFYMYFYAYNYGGNVLGSKKLNFGNHVGDWEHLMVRFSNGVPQAVWYSQHANGEAFKYDTVDKKDDSRPIAYSAQGTHANYAIPGTHDHTIPNFNLPAGVLEDHTDAGTLWDPLQSAYYYSYNAGENKFTAYDQNTPTAWLGFTGRWGDEEYPESDPRQVTLFGQKKFAGGPTGPADKQLNRKDICPENGQTCILRDFLVPRSVGLEEDKA
ncbi:hypothetical protein K504DRAFT_467679 [Pleomassaria siparia CBS 279.74]|uniref:Vacuolar protein sorting-associated protein 62 n=1 Tax=Pleomassaria siparia CBS 279.74 TaxID=1314801 RepID=A0A6G1KA06_9PLEO|nr:hypothetical protein K504DRAFT_467679 [Pleomassaria siparia CBS 279.74]